jgi:hypothetical protein
MLVIHKTNWKKILREIKMTDVEIAKAVHCSYSYVWRLRRGQRGLNISYDLGVRIMTLHKLRQAQSRIDKATKKKMPAP